MTTTMTSLSNKNEQPRDNDSGLSERPATGRQPQADFIPVELETIDLDTADVEAPAAIVDELSSNEPKHVYILSPLQKQFVLYPAHVMKCGVVFFIFNLLNDAWRGTPEPFRFEYWVETFFYSYMLSFFLAPWDMYLSQTMGISIASNRPIWQQVDQPSSSRNDTLMEETTVATHASGETEG